ncbi:hypothetical protein HZB97_03230 [Candidatus Gottesmanbacteria bacterium]|nr:hypothetical protein [Candidatus Gottesmanbacteria bacterium]
MNRKKFLIIVVFFFLAFSLTRLITLFDNKEKSEINQDILIEKKETRFLENGCPMNNNQDWMVGKAIGCEVSPDKELIGKFVFNSLYEPERYYELFIMPKDGGKEWRVFSGDFRTLGWEWMEDNRIKIIYNCGTGCKAVKVIGVDETLSISDYTDGKMDEKHGWEIKFSNLQ